MCVITVCTDRRLTDSLVEDCARANSDGIGIAWLTDRRVSWRKGITHVDVAKELAASTPLPYVMHFRIATVGGSIKPLTHPFPFDGTLDLQGSTKRGVLFHNGHWSDWKGTLLRMLGTPHKFPHGPWSDSRAMAYLARLYGVEVLELLEYQKIAVLTKAGVRIFGTGWTVEDGIQYSNTSFKCSTASYAGYSKDDERFYGNYGYRSYDHYKSAREWRSKYSSVGDRVNGEAPRTEALVTTVSRSSVKDLTDAEWEAYQQFHQRGDYSG